MINSDAAPQDEVGDMFTSSHAGDPSYETAVDDASAVRQVWRMTTTKLDLTGLKCPLPALKTRKALRALKPGDFLEVHCTDPLSVIDIPNLIRETGDKVEITENAQSRIVFLIEKANGLPAAAAGS
jgi:tRNA 2-thiouridine synthesizing protein A